MYSTQSMLMTHPEPIAVDRAALVECIEACFACAQTCTACADACLAEEMVEHLRHCIRTNLDCADICETTGRVLSRQTETNPRIVRLQVQTCAMSCQMCGEECQRHAQMHEHCKVCAEACRMCEQACNALLDAMPQ